MLETIVVKCMWSFFTKLSVELQHWWHSGSVSAFVMGKSSSFITGIIHLSVDQQERHLASEFSLVW